MMKPLFACATDWAGTGSMITGFATIAYALATGALATVGWIGLSAWRSQAGGTSKLESAQDVLAKVYEAQAVIEYVLGPWITPGEMSRVERGENESEEDYDERKVYGVARLRYLEHIESFNQLRALNFVARARLGDSVYEAVREVITFPNTIFFAGERISHAKEVLRRLERQAKLGLPVDEKAYSEAHDRHNKIYDVYHGMDENDSLTAQVTKKVATAEELLRQVIVQFE